MDSAAEEKPREDNAVECGQHEQVSRDHIPEGMSKNQWKKRLKQQRIEQGKAEWKYVAMYIHRLSLYMCVCYSN